MSQILSKIYQSMNIAVLERKNEHTFQLLTDAPKWLEMFCGSHIKINQPNQYIKSANVDESDLLKSCINVKSSKNNLKRSNNS